MAGNETFPMLQGKSKAQIPKQKSGEITFYAEAPSARHSCRLAKIIYPSSVQERHHWERTEDAAPPGLGILRASSGYKDSAPDGAEDAPQPTAMASAIQTQSHSHNPFALRAWTAVSCASGVSMTNKADFSGIYLNTLA